MAKFICSLSPDARFSFAGQNYNFIDGKFETADKDLITFMTQNPNFERSEEKEKVVEDVKKNIESESQPEIKPLQDTKKTNSKRRR